jgi:hypothetical protein
MGSHEMRVLTVEGLRVLDIEDADDRSVVGQHHNAIRSAMEGEISAIEAFVGRTISGRAEADTGSRPFELEARLKQLKRWYADGELDYEDIYEL